MVWLEGLSGLSAFAAQTSIANIHKIHINHDLIFTLYLANICNTSPYLSSPSQNRRPIASRASLYESLFER